MDFKKASLYCLLGIVAFMLWTSWVKEQVTVSSASDTNKIVSQSGLNSTKAREKTSFLKASEAVEQTSTQKIIDVKTDVLNVKIDTMSGQIVRSDLLNYPISLENKKPVALLDNSPQKLYVATSGLIENDEALDISFSAEQKHYELRPKENQLIVVLSGKTNKGLSVNKRFIFTRGKYLVKVDYELKNNSASSWIGNLYTQVARKDFDESSKGSLFGINSYEGAAISSGKHKPYEKITFKDIAKKPLDREISNGWIALQERYFLTAWIAEAGNDQHAFTQEKEGVYAIGMVGPSIKINPQEKISTYAKIYMGPELVDQLDEAAPNLKLTIDYGWLWFISIAIFWVMKHIHQIVGNWGWSIILVTVLIKLAFYRLSEASYRSMAKMQKFQPRLQVLRERFGEDRQRLNQAIMELYKKEKINPLGGCLPNLIQIPVFIALYWVLLESVQLRHAPFIFWIKDLSVRDPYFILPVLMGLTMFIQQRLSPAPPDPMQAKIMMALPVVFTFFFLYFPSGLVLYWVVSNGLSILQQWYITRKLANAPPEKPTFRKRK